MRAPWSAWHRHLAFALALIASGCGSVIQDTGKPNEPTIASVQPDHGSVVGGTMVSITGSNFQAHDAGPALVIVGGKAASNVAVVSDSQLTFTLPVGAVDGESVDVTVSNQNGFATAAAGFTYNRRPQVLTITPSSGKGSGGTAITITGRGFTDLDAGAAHIAIGGGQATSVTVVNDRTITAVTSAVTTGTLAFTPLDVTVSNGNGASLLEHAFSVTTHGPDLIRRLPAPRVAIIVAEAQLSLGRAREARGGEG